jgi:hypothetical protein
VPPVVDAVLGSSSATGRHLQLARLAAGDLSGAAVDRPPRPCYINLTVVWIAPRARACARAGGGGMGTFGMVLVSEMARGLMQR